MLKYITSIFCLFVGFFAQAQQEVSLPMLQDIPNSVHFNPAFTTGYRWTVSLPSISNNLVSNMPNVNSLFNNNGDGHYTLNFGQAVAELKQHNMISNVSKVELLGLSHQWEESSIHFNVGVRTQIGLDVPKGLAQIAALGNAPFIGKTLDIGPKVDVQAYTEFGLGYSRQFGKLRVGATGKYLVGVASAVTTKNEMSIYTDPEYYQLTAKADYEVQSSSLLALDSIGLLDLNKKVTAKLASANKGLAFDIGLVYDFSERFSMWASAIDIGSITWKQNAETYASQGGFTYNGVNGNGGLISIDSTTLSEFVDSIKQVFDFTTTSGSFKSALARQYLVGLKYKFGTTTLGASVDAASFLSQSKISAAFSVRTYVGKWVALGSVFSYKNNEIDHLGLNATFKVGPVQLYVLSDNALSYIFPETANDLHIRAGLNLVFGKIDTKETKYAAPSKSPQPHL